AFDLGSAIAQAWGGVPTEPVQYRQAPVPVTPTAPPALPPADDHVIYPPAPVPTGYPTVVVAPPAPVVQPGCLIPDPPPAAVPQAVQFQVGVVGRPRVQVVGMPQPAAVAVSQPLPCCAGQSCCATQARALSGTYYREMPGMVSAITFKGDELKATATVNDRGTV